VLSGVKGDLDLRVESEGRGSSKARCFARSAITGTRIRRSRTFCRPTLSELATHEILHMGENSPQDIVILFFER